MPMLAETAKVFSSKVKGAASALSIFSAIRATISGSRIFASMTMNSSPPWREMVSASRIKPCSRSTIAVSSLSPAWWPKLSLMFLKLSRSINISVMPDPARSALAQALAKRSRSNTRFGSLVSGSWCARNSMRSSAFFRSEMSEKMAT
ncbi:MAG: hypothetical protein ACD_10C00845G0002 [uncultured bacterium]|nr:MAG: hypothetical protein ACD_10C00845G0002 [uncultured bacterium]